VSSAGCTLDRWVVGGLVIAKSSRLEHNTERPDFGWLDILAPAAPAAAA
jgi:hypothetical protein